MLQQALVSHGFILDASDTWLQTYYLNVGDKWPAQRPVFHVMSGHLIVRVLDNPPGIDTIVEASLKLAPWACKPDFYEPSADAEYSLTIAARYDLEYRDGGLWSGGKPLFDILKSNHKISLPKYKLPEPEDQNLFIENLMKIAGRGSFK